ncbi:uncharacterized protein SAPINGB_P000127 [Magnusiomyces paraingens]|uniref:Uncharacterized protein n=1 Tax=Magnusiomyces paraingens TaxID=2606893 RepID=A0A5E8AXQ5_9ASCO|nr:uncharacterized protein SAPINGB_P000127 [Saprochaete ingens]VVT43746.1 unnamed protein product [Saprochaete ingens]
MSKVLVIDNGSYTIKIGHATGPQNVATPHIIPNCIAHGKNKRAYVGSQFSHCVDYSGLAFQRPLEKGQLVDWRLEFAIWNYTFFGADSPLTVDPTDSALILTEAPMSLPAISSNTDQIVFEEYGFESYYRCTPGSLVPWNNMEADLFGGASITNPSDSTSGTASSASASPPVHHPPLAECALVVDMGFNATTVLPTVLGEVYWPAVQQVSVGGRLLTNYLRETISFRHYNMMEETYLVNAVKEAVTMVVPDFDKALDRCKAYRERRGNDAQRSLAVLALIPGLSAKEKKIRYDDMEPYSVKYALPETPAEIGSILTPSSSSSISPSATTNPTVVDLDARRQILRLSTERFSVPELLFSPHHIGLNQAGLAETIVNAASKAPPELRSLLLANVVVVGGGANIPGVVERLRLDLAPYAASHPGLGDNAQDLLRVAKPKKDPETYAWHGGVRLAQQSEMLAKVHVTRADYLEYGERLCASKFNSRRAEDAEGEEGSGGVGSGGIFDQGDGSGRNALDDDDDDDEDDDDL